MLRVVELFAGIGSWSKALRRLGVDFEIVDAIEIDKITMRSYNLIHKTDFQPRDIRDVDENTVPDCDILFYSPPCQSWSKIGTLKGFNDEKGMLILDALRIILAKKPKIAVMENVSNLALKFRNEFIGILQSLELAGYRNYFKIMNPIDYNFPQSRERLFVVSVRNDIKDDYEFPAKEPLTKRFSDFLVDDYQNYLHSEKAIAYMNRTTSRGRTHWDFNHHNDTNIQYSRCITANFKKGVPYNVLIDRRNNKIVIRKHTPLEVARLMGFDDEDYQILEKNKISDTMIYQMMGNSIVVDILEKIFKNVIYLIDRNKK